MPEPTPRGLVPGISTNLVTADSLRNPLATGKIPNLETALELWRDKGDDSLMITRFMVALPRAHIPPEFVMLTYNWLDANNLPYYIHTHRTSESAKEKQTILEEARDEILKAMQTTVLPKPLKTVTLGYKHNNHSAHVLISGIGDFTVDKELKKKMGEVFELDGSAMKKSTFNPLKDFDTTIYLGLIPGIVGPLIEGHLVHNIAGICYLKPENPDGLVEVAVSPIDSLIMRSNDFTTALDAYAKAKYYGFARHETPENIFYINTA